MTSGVVDGVIVLEAHRLEGDGVPQFIRLLDDGLLTEGVLLAACHAGLQAHRVRNWDDPSRSCHGYLVSGVGKHGVRRHELLSPVPSGVPVPILQGPVARAGQHAQDLGHRTFLLFSCLLLPVMTFNIVFKLQNSRIPERVSSRRAAAAWVIRRSTLAASYGSKICTVSSVAGLTLTIGIGVAPAQSKTMTWRPTMSPRPRACMFSLMSSSLTVVTLCLIRPASASESTSTRSRWLPQKEPK